MQRISQKWIHLFFSDKNEWLLSSGCLDDKLKRFGTFDYNYHFVVGTIAIVKSNGWRIFDTLYLYPVNYYKNVQYSKEGIAEKGYILLWRDNKIEKYVPVLPD